MTSTRVNHVVAVTIIVSGFFLFIASIAVLVVALDIRSEQSTGRLNICEGRRLDNLPMTSVCADFYEGRSNGE